MEAVVKFIWGTDEACRQQRDASDQMLSRAEAKVDRLNAKLDEHPPRNLDETLYVMTHRSRE